MVTIGLDIGLETAKTDGGIVGGLGAALPSGWCRGAGLSFIASKTIEPWCALCGHERPMVWKRGCTALYHATALMKR